MSQSSSIFGVFYQVAHRLSGWLRADDTSTEPLDPAVAIDLQTLEDRVLYSAAPVPIDLIGQVENIELAIADFDSMPTETAWPLFETTGFESTTNDLILVDDWDANSLVAQDDFVPVTPEDADEPDAQRQELVVVDRGVDGYQELVDDLLRTSSVDSRAFQIIYLDSEQSGIARLTNHLNGGAHYDAIHLVSHGSDGRIQLGSDQLDSNNLNRHSSEIASWGFSLADDADFYIYGCDVASSQTGQELVAGLAELTGADVAASDDVTGHSTLGGDWDFEYVVGQVETEIAFSEVVQQEWQHQLLVLDAARESGAPTSAIGVDDAGRTTVVVSSDQIAGANGSDVYILQRDQFGVDSGLTRLNETTSGDQLHASVAVAANGTTGAVWTSVDGGDRGVFAKFLNGDGDVLRAEFRVDVPSATFNADDAAIAIDSVGNMVIVWEVSDGSSDSQIYGQRFNFDGTADGSQFQISDNSLSDSANADVAMNASGQFVVTWDTFNGDTFDTSGVYARTYNSNGTPTGTHFAVEDVGIVREHESAVDIDSTGRFVVSLSTASFGVEGLRVESFEFDGTAIDNYTNFYATPGTQHRSDIVLLENGNFIVSWEGEGPDGSGGTDTEGVYSATVNLASGAIVASADNLNQTGGPNPSSLEETTASLAKYRSNLTVDGYNGETVASGANTYHYTGASQIATEAPEGTDQNAVLIEDGQHTITVSDFGYSDAESASLAQIQVASIPANGQLLLDGVAVTERQVILAADIAADRLIYIPDPDYSGQDELSFFVHDGQIYSASFNTLTFDIEAVTDQTAVVSGDTLVSIDGGSLVNQTTTGDQSRQQITTLADGSYVVVWQSQDTDLTADNDGDSINDDGVQVLLQRFDATGNRVGSEQLIGSHLAGDQTLPNLAALADGGYVVVWADQDGGNKSISGQRFDSNGNSLNLDGTNDATGQAVFDIAQYDQFDQDQVTITALSDGGFVVAWSTTDQTLEADGSLAAVARIFSASGVAGPEFLLNETQPGGQSLVQTTQLAGGNVVFAWNDFNSNSIFYRVFDQSGNAVSSEQLAGNNGASSQFAHSIVASADGGFVLAWQQDEGGGNEQGIVARRFDADGNFIDASEIAINATVVGAQIFPEIISLHDGSIVIFWDAWATDGDRRGIVGRRFDSDLTPIGDEFVVNSRIQLDQTRPQATLLESGEIVVTFTSADGDNDGAGFGTGILAERLVLAQVTTEDQPIPLDLNVVSIDGDGRDSLVSFEATGIPAGSELTDGNFSINVTSISQVIDILGWDYANMSIVPPTNFSGDIQLSLTHATVGETATPTVNTDPVTNVIVVRVEPQNDVATYSFDRQVTSEDSQVSISQAGLFDASDDPDNAHINPTSTPSSSFTVDPVTAPVDDGSHLLWQSDFGPAGTISLDNTHVAYNAVAVSDYQGIQGSFDFDGSGGGTFTFPGSSTNSVAIEMWVRPDSSTAPGTLLEIGTSTNGIGIYLNNGRVELHVHAEATIGGQTTEPYVLVGGEISDTEFNQIVAVISGDGTLAGETGLPDVGLFVNGQLVDLLPDAGSLAGISSLSAAVDGAMGTTTGTFTHATQTGVTGFAGSIAQLSLIDETIDAQEVQALFMATAHGAHVVAVEGQALQPGTAITLASGALVTYQADGTLDYDPNGQFENLPEYDEFDSGTYVDDSFTISVSDGQGDSQDQTVVVRVTGSNDDPTLQITASGPSVPANTSTGTVVALADAQDVDDGENISYSLAGTITGAFSIDSISGEIKVADTTILKNPPGGLPHVVTVEIQDQEGVVVQESITLPLSIASDSEISGIVADDLLGDGSISGDSGILGVTVSLYQDSGDGIRDGSDVFIRSVTTGADGRYQFVGSDLDFGRFYVVVHSNTINASGYNSGFDQGDVWAEQTYASSGALYLNGVGTETISAGGTLFGGYSGTVSDDASSLLTAEHVTVVDVTTSTGPLEGDFGFSFNVMTNLEGGDDTDDDASQDRSVQGSLRQFIQNANAIDGSNSLRFVPRVEANSADNTWWTLTLSEELPSITDSYTVIDGVAYDLDGTTQLNINSRVLGQTINVGTGVDGVAATGDEYLLTGLDAPELEIVADTTVADPDRIVYGIVLEGTAADPTVSDITIRNLSIHDFGEASGSGANIFVAGAGRQWDTNYQLDAITIENNLIGSAPDSFSTTLSANAGSATGITVVNADAGIIRGNLIGNQANSGVIFVVDDGSPTEKTSNWVIEQNEIRANGQRTNFFDGVDLGKSEGTIVRQNVFADNHGLGIDSYKAIGSFQIYENLITGNGIGGVETGGIRLFGSGSTVTHNQLLNNAGAGIHVVGATSQNNELVDAATGNRISQNQFSGNTGLAIDLSSTIVDGKTFAELDVVTVDGLLSGSELPDGLTLALYDTDFSGAISQGEFDFASISIQQQGDGFSPIDGLDANDGNNGLDRLTLADAYFTNNEITIVVQVPAGQGIDEVEVYVATPDAGDVDGAENYGEGSRYLGTLLLSSMTFDSMNGTWSGALTEPVPGWPTTLNNPVPITVLGSAGSNTSEFSNNTTVNSLPTSQATAAIGIDEDETYSFKAADFPFNDNNTSDSLQAIRIDTLPSTGVLQFNGTDVVVGQEIAIGDIANLEFTPAANSFGAANDSFTYSVSDGQHYSASSYTISFDVAAVNDLPTGTSSTITIAEDTPRPLMASDFGYSDVETPSVDDGFVVINTVSAGTLRLGGTDVTDGQVIAGDQLGNLTFTPGQDANGTGYSVINFTVRDGDGADAASSNTLTVDVTPVNDLPTGTSSTISVVEDTTRSLTATDFGYSDVETTSVDDGFVVINTVSAGTLRLGGTDVTDGQVIAGNQLGNLTFTPGQDANGTGYSVINFTVRDGDGADAASPNTLTVDVTPTNDLPTGTSSTISVVEDTTRSLTATDFGYSDVETTSVDDGFVVINTVSAGTLRLGGTDVTDGQVIAGDQLGNLTFTPGQDANGTGYSVINFTVRDGDGADAASSNTLTVDVTPVNDLPTGTSSTISVVEDTTRSLTATDFGYSDVETTSVDDGFVVINTVSAGTLRLGGTDVTDGQVIAGNQLGNLTFTPGQDANGTGYSVINFTVRDGDGADAASPNTLTVDVTPTNDLPTGTSSTISVVEDTTRSLTATDFGYSDVETTSVDDGFVVINTVSAGILRLGGTDVTDGQVIAGNQLGNLTFTPGQDANGTGYSVINFTVRDGDGADSASSNTLTIDVTPVNDLPTGTSSTITIVEDTPRPLSAADFGYSDVETTSVDDGSVVINTVSAGTLRLGGTDVTDGQVIAGNQLGNLTFTPGLDANGIGYSVINFTVRDGDGADSASSNTLTIDVTPANDLPTGTSSTITIAEDVPRPLTAADFGYNDLETTSVDDGSVVINTVSAGILRLGGTDVTDGQVIAGNQLGNLTFTPGLNANGTGYSVINFTVRDGDGADAASSNTLTFDVTPVNDLPTGTSSTISVAEDTTRSLTASEFGYSDVETTSVDDGFVVINTVSAGTLRLGGTDVTDGQVIAGNQLGNLRFTPDQDANGTGYSVINFTVRDGDGADAATSNTLTIDVTSVNDRPTGTDSTINATEDVAYALAAGDFGYNDQETGVADGSLIINSVSRGRLELNGTLVSNGQVINGNQLGNLAFRSNLHENGVGYATINFTTNDGANGTGLDSAISNTMTINVDPVYDAPDINPDTYSTGEDVPLAVPNGANDLLANDQDFDGSTLAIVDGSMSATSLGTLLVNNVNGGFLYTPHSNVSGTESISYQVTDGTFVYSSSLTINIVAGNDRPEVVSPETASIDENSSYVMTLAGTDVEDGTVQDFAIIAGQDWDKFQIDNAGNLSFITPPNFESPTDQNENNVYRVRVVAIDSEGRTSANQLIRVAVGDVNEAPSGPAVWNSRLTGDGNTQTGVVNLGSLVDDPDAGDSAAFILTEDAQYGNVQIDSQGRFTYAATGASPDDFDQFRYRIVDGAGLTSDVMTLRIGLADFVFVPVEQPREDTIEENTADSAPDDGSQLETPTTVGTSANDSAVSSFEDAPLTYVDSGANFASSGTTGYDGNENEDSELDLGQVSIAKTYVSASETVTADLLQVSNSGARARAGDPVELELEVFASVFWDELNSSKRDYLFSQVQIRTPEIAASAATLLTMSYLVWNMGSGILLTTFMSSLPAWSSFDILPVIASAELAVDDGESIEQMVDA